MIHSPGSVNRNRDTGFWRGPLRGGQATAELGSLPAAPPGPPAGPRSLALGAAALSDQRVVGVEVSRGLLGPFSGLALFCGPALRAEVAPAEGE